jgi:hypothetical protein
MNNKYRKYTVLYNFFKHLIATTTIRLLGQVIIDVETVTCGVVSAVVNKRSLFLCRGFQGFGISTNYTKSEQMNRVGDCICIMHKVEQ